MRFEILCSNCELVDLADFDFDHFMKNHWGFSISHGWEVFKSSENGVFYFLCPSCKGLGS